MRTEGQQTLISSVNRLARSLEVGVWREADIRDLIRSLRRVPGWALKRHEGAVAHALLLLGRNDRAEDALHGSLLVLAYYLDRKPKRRAAKRWTKNVRHLLKQAGEAASDDEIRQRARDVAPKPEPALSKEAFERASPSDKAADILQRHLVVPAECLVMGGDVFLDFGMTKDAHRAMIDEFESALDIEVPASERAGLRLINNLYNLHMQCPESRRGMTIGSPEEDAAPPAQVERYEPEPEPKGPALAVHRDPDGVLVYRFAGHMDRHRYEDMQDASGQTLDRVLVDLRGVVLGGASFKAILVQLFQRVKEAEGRIVFAAPNKQFRRELEISELNNYFDVFEDMTTARKRLLAE